MNGAQGLAEAGRRHFNSLRPHDSPGYRPPAPEAIVPLSFTGLQMDQWTVCEHADRTNSWGLVTNVGRARRRVRSSGRRCSDEAPDFLPAHKDRAP